MEYVNFALIGLGALGQDRLKIYSELMKKDKGVRLVAVCDKNKDRAKKAGDQMRVPYYLDVEDMLRKQKNIDVVDICTPHFDHHATAKLAMEYGKHVLVEKPLALTVRCAKLIAEAKRKHNVLVEYGENFIRLPQSRIICKIIEHGHIGKILRAYTIDKAARSESPLYPAKWQKTLGLAAGGHCMEIGIHRVAQMRLFIKSDAVKVVGLTLSYEAEQTESWGHAIITFRNGAIGIYEGEDFIEKKISTSVIGRYIQIVGEEGTILLDNQNKVHLYKTTGEWARHKEITVQHITKNIDGVNITSKIIVGTDPPLIYENELSDCALNDYFLSFAEEILDIAEAIKTGKEVEYTVEDGIKDMEMVTALYESSLMGMQPINLPLETTSKYEEKVHEGYEKIFGRSPLDV